MAIPSIKLEPAISKEIPIATLSRMQRYMLRRFHPRSLILETVASIWAVYFFWHHQWVTSLLTLAAGRLIGNLLAATTDYSTLAASSWGRLAMLHLHPMNYAIQFVGAVVAFYGIWMHSTVSILVGLSIVFLGHLWGWQKLGYGL